MTEARTEKIIQVLQRRQTGLTLVLENVFDRHNVSAIMRTADAVGVGELYVVNTQAPATEHWGYRSSSGAYKWVKVHQFDELETCMIAVRNRYEKVLTTHLSSEAVSLFEIDFTQSIALVFGNEQKGVSEALRGMADGNFIIPQMGMIHSLNISVACAVSLYEALRQKSAAGHYNQQQISAEQFDHLFQDWTTHPRLRDTGGAE
ncbi:TrmH family RNA methyltransferase [Pseudocnuella soli]|uniref:TrmH family RNA methyltransferase n=1 Tax=Pseudocnuella soli TaxID=2502779 RepID=UPI0010467E24|nr:RNA methyltransferase [Pseudocnuella soli]